MSQTALEMNLARLTICTKDDYLVTVPLALKTGKDIKNKNYFGLHRVFETSSK